MSANIFSRRASDQRVFIGRGSHDAYAGLDPFGLRAAMAALLRYRWLALSAWAACIGIAVLYVVLSAPAYRADTSIQIEPRSKRTVLPSLPGSERTAAEPDRVSVSGELEVLASRELLRPVIAEAGANIDVGIARRWGVVPVGYGHGIRVAGLQLPANSAERTFELKIEGEQWSLLDESGVKLTGERLGATQAFVVDGQPARITVTSTPGRPHAPELALAVRLLDPAAAHESVVRRLKMFEPARDSNVVRISWEDRDPETTARFLNALAQAYFLHTLERKRGDSAKALAAVEADLPNAKARVLEAEDALARYQSESRAVAAPTQVEADALLRQRVDLERQAVELRVKRDQLAQSLTPEHPDMVVVLQQLATVQGALARLGQNTNRLPEQQREVSRLQREVQSQSQLYAALQTHAQQLGVMLSSGLNDARQIDLAVVPLKPIRPNVGSLISMGVGLGLVMAFVLVLVKRSLNPTVALPGDLPAKPGAPWYSHAVLPDSSTQHRLMAGRKLGNGIVEEIGTHRLLARAVYDDPAVESLRALAMGLTREQPDGGAQVVMVTAPSAGCGKSFVAANLAALLAAPGDRVLLIEADLARPALHRYVSMDPAATGLIEMLESGSDSLESVRTHATAGFDVLLGGSRAARISVEVLARGLSEYLEQWSKSYAYIVIEAPALPSGATLAIGRLADAAVLVMRSQYTLQVDAQVSLHRLEQAGVRVEAVVLNRVRNLLLGSAVAA